MPRVLTRGSLLKNSESSLIESITANNNFYGVATGTLSNSIIQSISANDNEGLGLDILNSNNNDISGISTSGNGYNGVRVENSNGNTLSNITTNGDILNGVYLKNSDDSDLSSISADNTIVGNGILIVGSNNELTDSNADNNAQYGIQISGSNNNVTGSIFSGNAERDVGSEYTTNIFKDCTYDTEEGSLTRQYTYQAIVEDDLAQLINDALVTALRQTEGQKEETAFALRTNPDGTTPPIPVTAYVLEKEIRTADYFPLEITAEKDGLISSHIWLPDGTNTQDKFILE